MKPRHATRLLVPALLAASFWLNNYYVLKGQIGGTAEIQSSPLYTWIDKLHGASPHRQPYQPFAQGGLWSFRFRGFRVSDPLAVLGELAVLKRVHAGFLASALLPVALTLLLGRVFCSWICPMGLLSEAVTGLRGLLARVRVHAFAFALTNRIKYAVLTVGLAFGLFLSLRFFFWIYPPRILSDMLRDSLLGERVSGTAAMFTGILLLLELLFVERLWCRCLCPGGALYSLLGRWRLLRVARDSEVCTQCLDCDRACPHDLMPSHEELSGECDNCGLCRASCEPRALHYTLSVLGRNERK